MKINELRQIVTLFNLSEVKYYLIRPIDLKDINSLVDIDIVISFKDLVSFFNYLKSHKIKFKCIDNYVYNKIIVVIDNNTIIIDININEISYSQYKIILLTNNVIKYDYIKISNFEIPILPEPYLFINWTLHYILDKKDFFKGGSHKMYSKKYHNSYQEILNEQTVFNLLSLIYKSKTKDVIEILKNNLFKNSFVLNKNEISILNSMAFKEQNLIILAKIFRVKMAITKRLKKYVFKKNIKTESYKGKIRLFPK